MTGFLLFIVEVLVDSFPWWVWLAIIVAAVALAIAWSMV